MCFVNEDELSKEGKYMLLPAKIKDMYKVIPEDKTDGGRMKESEWDWAEGYNKALSDTLKLVNK